MADLAMGTEVRLHMRGGATHQGFVFCCDKDSDVLVLEEPHPQSTLKEDARFLKLSNIDKIERLEGRRNEDGPLPDMSPALIADRERAGVERAAREADRRGEGVSAQAQQLFDALDKTYRVKWRGHDIVSELGIVIKPPYTAASCEGRDVAALGRFRSMVDKINNARLKAGQSVAAE